MGRLLISYLLVLAAHTVLNIMGILKGSNFVYSMIDTFLALIFIGGTLISYPGLKKGGESFVQRFLIMTTVQMLLMLSVILTIAYTKLEHVKHIGFSLVSVFAIMLLLQSLFFIGKVRK